MEYSVLIPLSALAFIVIFFARGSKDSNSPKCGEKMSDWSDIDLLGFTHNDREVCSKCGHGY